MQRERKRPAHFQALLVQKYHTCSFIFSPFPPAWMMTSFTMTLKTMPEIRRITVVPSLWMTPQTSVSTDFFVCPSLVTRAKNDLLLCLRHYPCSGVVSADRMGSWAIKLRLKQEGANCAKTSEQEGVWGGVSGRSNCTPGSEVSMISVSISRQNPQVSF